MINPCKISRLQAQFERWFKVETPKIPESITFNRVGIAYPDSYHSPNYSATWKGKREQGTGDCKKVLGFKNVLTYLRSAIKRGDRALPIPQGDRLFILATNWQFLGSFTAFSDWWTTSSQAKPRRDVPWNVPTVVYWNENCCKVTMILYC